MQAQVTTGSASMIAGYELRHDTVLRDKILAANSYAEWVAVVKDMCAAEGQNTLMADTVALFYERCGNGDLTMQIRSMVTSRPPAGRREWRR